MKKMFIKRMRKKLHRFTAVLMVVVMILGFIPLPGINEARTVEAAETSGGNGNAMLLCTSGILDWSGYRGQYVYYGTVGTVASSKGQKFRILKNNATSSDKIVPNGVLLDCDDIIAFSSVGESKANSSQKSGQANEWKGSKAETWLNGENYYGSSRFTTAERAAILKTQLSDYSYDDPFGGYKDYAAQDYVFLLSIKELYSSYSGAFISKNGEYWLRSACDNTESGMNMAYVGADKVVDNTTTVGSKTEEGSEDLTVTSPEIVAEIGEDNVANAKGISPAFNVDKTKILFTTTTQFNKSRKIAKIEERKNKYDEWKFTMKTSDMSVSMNDKSAQLDGYTITIPYKYQTTEDLEVNQLSILITDKAYTSCNQNNANILYYGELENIKNTRGLSAYVCNTSVGTGSFTLPEDLRDKKLNRDYYIYLVSEHFGGSCKTDYSSEVFPISIPVLEEGYTTYMLGTSLFDKVCSNKWQTDIGLTVSMGKYEGKDISWRVLNYDKNSDTVLLDANNVLTTMAYDDDFIVNDGQTTYPNNWKGSDIETWLNGEEFYLNNDVFSDKDRESILTSDLPAANKAGSSYSDDAARDKLFLLSSTDLEKYYASTSDYLKYNLSNEYSDYWLRTSYTLQNGEMNAYVNKYMNEGRYTPTPSNEKNGVSPALKIKASDIFAVVADDKYSKLYKKASGFPESKDTTSTKWRLTLIDRQKTIAIEDKYHAYFDENILCVPYVCTDTATSNKANQISVVITDMPKEESKARIVYYSALNDTNNDAGELILSKTGYLPLGQDLCNKIKNGQYYVYIMAENRNDSGVDYVSEPILLTDFTSRAKNEMTFGHEIYDECETHYHSSLDGNYTYFGRGGVYAILSTSKDSVSNEDSILFDAQSSIGKQSYNETNTSVQFQNSDINSWINDEGFYNNDEQLSKQERQAIANTVLMDTDNSIATKIFLLNENEISSLYAKTPSKNDAYWLRNNTVDNSEQTSTAKLVSGKQILNVPVTEKVDVMPAFNVKKDAVLFYAQREKNHDVSRLITTISNIWYVTLKDDGKKISIQENDSAYMNENTIYVPYTYSDTSNNVNQISVMITDRDYTDKDAQILCYGALNNITTMDGKKSSAEEAKTGIGSFVIPYGWSYTPDAHIYILAECVTGTTSSDYASLPVQIEVKEDKNAKVKKSYVYDGANALYDVAYENYDSDNAKWNLETGATLYYGHYEGRNGFECVEVPTEYRMLLTTTPWNAITMTDRSYSVILDSSVVTDRQKGEFARNGNSIVDDWRDSAAFLYYVKFYGFNAGNMSETERQAIAWTNTTLNSYSMEWPIYALSKEQVENYYDNDKASLKKLSTDGYAANWGIYDKFTDKMGLQGGNVKEYTLTSFVDTKGELHAEYKGNADFLYEADRGTSPAFSVDFSQVLFVTDVEMDKSAAMTKNIKHMSSNKWKLTLKDNTKRIKITDGQNVTLDSDGKLTIPYTCFDGWNEVNQISFVIRHENQVIYYGSLQDVPMTNGIVDETGIGTVILPQDIFDNISQNGMGSYEFSIYAEKVSSKNVDTTYNGKSVVLENCWTDYASDKCVISFAKPYNNIEIGATALVAADRKWTSEAGEKVFLGQNNGNGIEYRALGKTIIGEDPAIINLDCDTVLFDNVADDKIDDVLNGDDFYGGNKVFSSTEKTAILSVGVGNALVLLVTYGFDELTKNGLWWMSAGSSAYVVYQEQNVLTSNEVTSPVGVSPYIQLDGNLIMFTVSSKDVDKSGAMLKNKERQELSTWEITFRDDKKTIALSDEPSEHDGIVTVPYAYTDKNMENATSQISVVITDKEINDANAKVLYYGALSNIRDENGEVATVESAKTGKGEFILPEDCNTYMLGTEYHVYILAECVNSMGLSDYASSPVEITDIGNESEIHRVDINIEEPIVGQPFPGHASSSNREICLANDLDLIWKCNGVLVSNYPERDKTYQAIVCLNAEPAYVFADDVTVWINGKENSRARICKLSDTECVAIIEYTINIAEVDSFNVTIQEPSYGNYLPEKISSDSSYLTEMSKTAAIKWVNDENVPISLWTNSTSCVGRFTLSLPDEWYVFSNTPEVIVNGTTVPVEDIEKVTDSSIVVTVRYSTERYLTGIATFTEQIERAHGTALTQSALGLPGAVTIFTNTGEDRASVIWDLSGIQADYDAENSSEQWFKIPGTVSLPNNLENSMNLSLETGIWVFIKPKSVEYTLSETKPDALGIHIYVDSPSAQNTLQENGGSRFPENATVVGEGVAETSRSPKVNWMKADGKELSEMVISPTKDYLAEVIIEPDIGYDINLETTKIYFNDELVPASELKWHGENLVIRHTVKANKATYSRALIPEYEIGMDETCRTNNEALMSYLPKETPISVITDYKSECRYSSMMANVSWDESTLVKSNTEYSISGTIELPEGVELEDEQNATSLIVNAKGTYITRSSNFRFDKDPGVYYAESIVLKPYSRIVKSSLVFGKLVYPIIASINIIDEKTGEKNEVKSLETSERSPSVVLEGRDTSPYLVESSNKAPIIKEMVTNHDYYWVVKSPQKHHIDVVVHNGSAYCESIQNQEFNNKRLYVQEQENLTISFAPNYNSQELIRVAVDDNLVDLTDVYSFENVDDYHRIEVWYSGVKQPTTAIPIEVSNPVAGEALPTNITSDSDMLNATSKTAEITWKQNGEVVTGIANYNKVYVGELTLYSKNSLTFEEGTLVSINGQAPASTTYNEDGSITITWAVKTGRETLISVEQPEEITVPYATELTQEALGLPETTKIKTDNGEIEVAIDWRLSEITDSIYDPTLTTEQKFIVKGSVSLPDNVGNPDLVSRDVRAVITVLEAGNYIITASAGENGNITPAGETTVIEHSDKTFFIAPDYGYLIAEVLVDGRAVEVATSYTFTDVAEEHTIEVRFAEDTSILEPAIINRVDVTIDVPEVGCAFAEQAFVNSVGIDSEAIAIVWTDNNTPAGTVADYSKTYTATIQLNAKEHYVYSDQVIVLVNGHLADGMIDVSGNKMSLTVQNSFSTTRAAVTEIISPESLIDVDTGSEKTVEGLGLPTTVKIKTQIGDMEATVDWNLDTFVKGTYDPTSLREQSFTVGGIVSLPDSVQNTNGLNLAITIDVVVCGAEICVAPTADHISDNYANDISVKLETITENAEIYYTLDGSIPSKTNGIKYTNAISLTGTKGTSVYYVINAIAICDGKQNSRVITYDYNIEIPIPTYTITATSGANGSISPTGAIAVEEGASQIFLCEPNEGYVVDTIVVDDVEQMVASSYTFSDVQSEHTIYVSFKEKEQAQVEPTIINTIAVTLETPTGANVLAENAQVIAAGITEESRTAKVKWTTEGAVASGMAMFDTKYIGEFSIVARDDYVFDTNTTITVNGETVEGVRSSDGKSFTVYYDINTNKPKLLSITDPEAISSIPNGTALAEETMGLPDTVELVAEDGAHSVLVKWDLLHLLNDTTYSASNVEAQTFMVAGYIELPEYLINPDKLVLSTSCVITVDEADTVSKPYANVENGFYDNNVNLELKTDTENAEIYYTLDGSVPTKQKGLKYTGSISLKGEATKYSEYEIRAIAVCPGMKDSEIVTFNYTIKLTDEKYVINASSGANGIINPEGEIAVSRGENKTFIISPALGYVIDTVKIDGAFVDVASSYTFENIESDHSIRVTFKQVAEQEDEHRVNRIDIEIDSFTGGVAFPKEARSTTEGIASACDITWKREDMFVDGTADFNTEYSGSFVVSADGEYKIYENADVYVNGAKLEDQNIRYSEDGELYVTYKTKTARAKLIEDVRDFDQIKGIANQTELSVEAMGLPTTINVVTNAGEMQATVTWDLSKFVEGSYDQALNTSQTFVISGTVSLPNDISNPDGYKLDTTIEITVDEEGKVGIPSVSPIAGRYTENQMVILTSSTQDADIYYTLDGTEPSETNGTKYKSAIEVTGIKGESVETTITAVAVKQGMENSDIVSFEFTIELPVNKYSITATAGANGSISSVGTSECMEGETRTYTFTPNDGYEIDIVTVDDVIVGNVESYTFESISDNHTIDVKFKVTGEPSVTELIPVEKVNVKFDAPGGGKPFALDTLAEGTGVESVASIIWTRTTGNVVIGVAAYNEEYIAYITVRPEYGYTFDENTVVILNDEIIVDDHISYNDDGTITFKYNTVSSKEEIVNDVESPGDINGVENGSELTEEGLGLPTQVPIPTETGEVMAEVKWSFDDVIYYMESEDVQTLYIYGTIILPDNIENPNGYDLNIRIKVTVNAKGTTGIPVADIAQGTYKDNLEVKLTAAEDAVIVYTMDGTTPSSTNGKLYKEGIQLTGEAGERKSYEIKAIAMKDGLNDSEIVTYNYVIAIPANEYVVTASAREHGIISPSGNIVIIEKQEITFDIIPDNGYEIESIMLNGKDVTVDATSMTRAIGNQKSYILSDVSSDSELYVTFKKIVNITDPDNGGGNPSDPDNGGGNSSDPDNGGGNSSDPDNGGGNPSDPDNGGGNPPDPDNGGGNPSDPDNGGGNPSDPDNGGGNPSDPDNGGGNVTNPDNNDINDVESNRKDEDGAVTIKDQGNGSSEKTAKTGDSTNLQLYFFILFVSAFGLVYFARRKKLK